MAPAATCSSSSRRLSSYLLSSSSFPLPRLLCGSLLRLLSSLHHHQKQQESSSSSSSQEKQLVYAIVLSGVGSLDDMERSLDQLQLPIESITPSLVDQVFDSWESASSQTSMITTRRLLRFFSWSQRQSCGGGLDEQWVPTFNRATRAFAHRKDLTAMRILVSDLQRDRRLWGMDQETFAGVIEALVDSGREDDAVRLFRNLVEKKNNQQEQQQQGGGGEEEIGRVIATIHALCARGHARKAEGVVWHHRDKLGPALDTCVYKSILRGWCVRGNAKEARRVLEQMKSAGICPGLASYNTFLRCICQRNLKFNPSALVKEAADIMVEMRAAGMPPTAVSCNILLACLGRKRRVKEAYRVLYSMRTGKEGCPSPDWLSYYIVVRVLYLTGRFIRGNRLVCQMIDEDRIVPGVRFFRGLVGILLGVENVGCAIEMFELMKRGCGEDECGPVYDMLITKLCKSGEFDMGRCLWDEAADRGVLLRCSNDLLDPSKTEVFKPTKEMEKLDSRYCNSVGQREERG